jgi:Type I restriction enzyme HindI endonuclease subunit-like, C-terminal
VFGDYISVYDIQGAGAGRDGPKQRHDRLDLRENVRAQLRVLVKRILRKYGYPPDKQEKASRPCLSRRRLLCREWVVKIAV